MAESLLHEGAITTKTASHSPIHIIDSCLFDALVFLTRDDLDPLPIVNRQFSNLLSHPHFDSAPLRIFYEGTIDLHGENSRLGVDVNLLEKHGRLFSHRRKLTRVTIGEDVYGRPGRLVYHRMEIPRTEILEMLQCSPWIRVYTTTVDLKISDYQNPSQELEAQIAQGLLFARLWSGSGLEIKLWESNYPSKKDSQRWSAETVDLGRLAAGCSWLKFVDHASFPRASFVDWMAKSPCNNIKMKWSHGALTPQQIVDYLLTRVDGDNRTMRTLGMDSNVGSGTRDYLNELHVLIKEKFINTAQSPPFSLSLGFHQGGGYPADDSLPKIYETHAHPDELIGGLLFIQTEHMWGEFVPAYAMTVQFPTDPIP